MSLVDPECPAIVRAFSRRTPRRPPERAQAGRDPMFRRTGSSFDLKNIREYAPSDDPRRIDWRLEGRTGRLYVKEYYEEERDGLLILVDSSASMAVHGLEVLERLAASVAWMLGALGLPTSLMDFSDRTGRRLDRPRGGESPAPVEAFFAGFEARGRTDLAAAIAGARRRSRYRRLLVLSDFLDPRFRPETSPFSRNFYLRLHRHVMELGPGRAEIEVLDPESGERLLLPWDAGSEAAYRERETALDARLREAARRGAFYRSLGPTENRVPLYWSLLEALYA